MDECTHYHLLSIRLNSLILGNSKQRNSPLMTDSPDLWIKWGRQIDDYRGDRKHGDSRVQPHVI